MFKILEINSSECLNPLVCDDRTEVCATTEQYNGYGFVPIKHKLSV